MRTTRITAGLYEVHTDTGIFVIERTCDVWTITTPEGRSFHVPTYRDARKVLLHWSVYPWSHTYEGYSGLELMLYRPNRTWTDLDGNVHHPAPTNH